MLTIISPAKTLDFESKLPIRKHTTPRLVDDAEVLIDELVQRSPDEVSGLMDLSPELTKLNVDRYSQWEPDHRLGPARQALFAFKGDVYVGMEPEELDGHDLNEAQKALRILSGLYGVLRPLDLMQPYRLEMGTALRTDRGRNLYEFWGRTIAEMLNRDLDDRPTRVLVNLASQEYFGAVDLDVLDARVITPRFLDEKNGQLKVISFFAKKARGAMAAWIIRSRAKSPKRLVGFDGLGYRYDDARSTPDEPTFVRLQQ